MENTKKIVGTAEIAFDNETHVVEVYEDGTFVLPNGQRAKLSPESLDAVIAKAEQTIGDSENALKMNHWKSGQAGISSDTNAPQKKKKAGKKDLQTPAAATEIVLADYAKKERRQKAIAVMVYVLLIVGIVFGALLMLRGQQRQVEVIRLKETVQAGDIYADSMIEPLSLLQSEYERLGTAEMVKDDGSKAMGQTIILWKDREEKLLGKYATNYIQTGQYVTSAYVTSETIARNSWLATVDPTREIYTLPFTAKGVNTNLLLPGTHLRVRIVVQPDKTPGATEAVNGAKNVPGVQVADDGTGNKTDKKVADAKETDLKATDDKTSDTKETEKNDVPIENELDTGAVEQVGYLPVAEVVFDDIKTVDMLNSSNESIYDVYLALAKKTTKERIEYLQTTLADDDKAKEFQERVAPTQLVLALTREQATAMAKFENLEGASIKYTILVNENKSTDDENLNALLNSFVEISSEISNIQSAQIKQQTSTATVGKTTVTAATDKK